MVELGLSLVTISMKNSSTSSVEAFVFFSNTFDFLFRTAGFEVTSFTVCKAVAALMGATAKLTFGNYAIWMLISSSWLFISSTVDVVEIS